MNVRRNTWVLAAIAGLWMTSCKKDETIAPTQPVTSTEDQTVNDWVLSEMKKYYYWNDKLPANPNKALKPADFFSSLLYKYDAVARPDGDRFSWIQESADELKASLSGEVKSTGVEFTLLRRASGSDDVIAQVLYVQPGSPGAAAGVKRGDIIYKVNGQKLTVNNYQNLLFSPTAFTYGLAKLENRTLVDTDETRSVTASTIQENPVYLDSIYVRNGKTIGYLVYNQFIPGPNGSSTPEYDRRIDQIFSKFKAQGVNELILDFRYNPGGYVSSSVNIASLVGKGVDNSKVYYRMEYNKDIMKEVQAAGQTGDLITRFSNKANNIGGNLQRVFVLTTGRTASASELIINGLKPFMPVVTIGGTTTGKNVGSITLTDDKGKIKWGIQPIVFKSFNSEGTSEYSAGFKPAFEVAETVESRTKPLGDVNEALLNEALFQITGNRSARRAARNETVLPEVGSSIERKAGGSNMFEAAPKLK